MHPMPIDEAAVSGPGDLNEPTRIALSAPMAMRNKSLLVIATLACIFTLHWASAVFIPVMVGLLFSYALSPVVAWFQVRGIARVVSAAVLVLGVVGGFGAIVYSLADDASTLVDSLPAAARKLHQAVRSPAGWPDGTIATVQKAAAQIEKTAEEATQSASPSRGVQRVQIVKSKFEIKDHLWSGTLGVLATLSQVGMVSLITFFLLASGDQFRRKLVKLAGPTLAQKRVTLQAINEIHDQIQRYMLVQLFTSVVVGVATWLCFLAIGVENAAVWGVAAGVFDLIPYVGSVVIGTGSALLGFMQFGTLEMALLVGGASLVIQAVEAILLTPWLTSRANKLNPVAIFVGVLAWGWLWGIWGMLLGVPILVAINAICGRIEEFKPVAEFLGD
jgi:predicted PurR-regulated permease PerM